MFLHGLCCGILGDVKFHASDMRIRIRTEHFFALSFSGSFPLYRMLNQFNEQCQFLDLTRPKSKILFMVQSLFLTYNQKSVLLGK